MKDKAKAGGETAQRISALRWHAPAILIAIGGAAAVTALALFLFAGLHDKTLFIALGFMGVCYAAAAFLTLANS